MKTNSLLGLTSFQLANEKKILDQLFVTDTDNYGRVYYCKLRKQVKADLSFVTRIAKGPKLHCWHIRGLEL